MFAISVHTSPLLFVKRARLARVRASRLMQEEKQVVVVAPLAAPTQASMKPVRGVDGDVSDPPDPLAEKTLITVMGCVLEQLVERNDRLGFDSSDVAPTIFHGLHPPNLSIKAYLQRIYKYTNVSSGCLVFSLLFIDRFMERNKSIMLTSRNVHRLVITAVVVSMKFLDDLYYNNAYYAKIGGIALAEMNALELEFLFRINFDLHAPQAEYEHYYNELGVHARNATNCSCRLALAESLVFGPFSKPPPVVSPPMPVPVVSQLQAELQAPEESACAADSQQSSISIFAQPTFGVYH